MRISQLLTRFKLECAAAPASDFEIKGVRPLADAGSGDLSFLASPRYKAQALTTGASAILVKAPVAGVKAVQILCRDPHLILAAILEALYPEPPFPELIHPSAVIETGARIGKQCHIGPFCLVGENASIGDGTVLVSHVTVSRDCVVGKGTMLFSNVVLYPRTSIGNRVRIHANTVIGGDGFGYAQDQGRHVKIPQIGRAIIEDDVEIGCNSSVDRGALSDTVIGRGSKIDNQVQVGHGVTIGKHCILVSQAALSGSARLGDYVILAGKAATVGHISVADKVLVMGDAVVTKDLKKAGRYAGNPAVPHMQYQRQLAHLRRLPELRERLKALENTIEKEARS